MQEVKSTKKKTSTEKEGNEKRIKMMKKILRNHQNDLKKVENVSKKWKEEKKRKEELKKKKILERNEKNSRNATNKKLERISHQTRKTLKNVNNQIKVAAMRSEALKNQKNGSTKKKKEKQADANGFHIDSPAVTPRNTINQKLRSSMRATTQGGAGGKRIQEIPMKELKVTMSYLKEKNFREFILAIDIGGTNTRVAFYPIKNGPIILVKFLCSRTDVLLQKFRSIARTINQVFPNTQIVKYCCFSIAGMVSKEKAVHITLGNYEEGFKKFSRKNLPERLFPYHKTYCLNDIEACCHGLIRLGKKDLLKKYFSRGNFFSENDEVLPKGLMKNSYLVINMGTGFGASIIYYSQKTNDYEVIPMEMGRSKSFFTPNDEDLKVLQGISEINFEKYKSSDVLITDLCSCGKGIGNILASKMRQNEGYEKFDYNLSHEEKGDVLKFNKEVQLFFLKYIIRVAQNMCVMFPKLKGILLTGDNIVRNKKILLSQDVKHQLTQTFMNHDRQSWIFKTIAYLQIKDYNFNLYGAQAYVREKLENEFKKNK